MTIKNILLILNFILLVALVAYLIYDKTQVRTAYILNQEVFNQFKGKQDLEKKLNDVKSDNKRKTDSLMNLLSVTRTRNWRSNTGKAFNTLNLPNNN